MLERTLWEMECGRRTLKVNQVKAFNEDSCGGSFPALRKALGEAKMSTVVVESPEPGTFCECKRRDFTCECQPQLVVKLSVTSAGGAIIDFLEPLHEFPSATLLAQVMLIV